MNIVERLKGGYLVVCTCGRGERFFQRSHGMTVECPHCGKVQPVAELVTAWVLDRAEAEAGRQAA